MDGVTAGSTQMPVVLRSIDDVDALIGWGRTLFGAPPVRKVRLAVADLPKRESGDAEVRLNALVSECGCHAGGVLASFALVFYVGFLFATAGSMVHWRFSHVLWGGFVCIACGLAGKVFGVVRARVRFVKELQCLRLRLSERRLAVTDASLLEV